MLLRRNVQASIRTWLDSVLSNTSAAYQTAGIPVYNVYGETELRDESFSPVYPYIYVLSERLPFNQKHLPAIVIDASTSVATALEMGSRKKLKVWDCSFEIYGRHKAEREDLAEYLEELLETAVLDIYDYTESPATLLASVPVDDDLAVGQSSIGDEQAEEGTLLNWITVICSFETFGI